MTRYDELRAELRDNPRTWLITGVAGFIGSNLLECLLKLNQRVIGLDNFATGYRRNLDEVKALVEPSQWARFEFIEGDICDLHRCRGACDGVDYVLHQAALGSVPRSIADPVSATATNVVGFVNMLVAARDSGVETLRLRREQLHLWRSSKPAEGRRIYWPAIEPLRGHQICERALC